jgi:hypothetical protein
VDPSAPNGPRKRTEVPAVVVVGIWAGALQAAGCVGAPTAVDSGAPSKDAIRSPDAAVGPRSSGPHDSPADFVDAHFSADAWREDVGHGYFGSSSVWLPAGLALGAGAIAPWDHAISHHSRDSSTTLGEVTLASLLVGTAAVGVLAPGDGRDGAEERWNMCEAMALDAGATSLLKSAVGRNRPGGGGGTSFPSGHASAAFGAATLIDRNFGHALGIPAYVVASATAVSRVEARRHFPSDVLAGAALGTLSVGVVDALHFGGDEKDGGISRRRGVSADVGIEAGPDGRRPDPFRRLATTGEPHRVADRRRIGVRGRRVADHARPVTFGSHGPAAIGLRNVPAGRPEDPPEKTASEEASRSPLCDERPLRPRTSLRSGLAKSDLHDKNDSCARDCRGRRQS